MKPITFVSSEGDTKNKAAVLVVDDNNLSRKTISAFLAKNGMQVTEAENGREALEKLKTEHFDLVLTDICMPVMDGRELLKLMSEQFSEIPRIVLTAHDNEDDILLALKTGAYDYMIKPVTDFHLLIYSVNRALERRFLKLERDKTIKQIEHVNRVVCLLNQGKDVEEIFIMLCNTLSDFVPYEKILILDCTESSNKLLVKHSFSYIKNQASEGAEITLTEEFAAYLEQQREPVIVNDIPGLRRNKKIPDSVLAVLNAELGSAITAPLIIDNQIRGFLLLASKNVDEYTADHGRFLSLIGGQVALSLQRGELLSNLANHTRHLEKTVKKRTHDVLRAQKTTIFALSKLAEIRDNETGRHLDRMRNYALILAQMLKYSGDYEEIDNEFAMNIYDSSILHDIGKVGIPDSILLKPAPLSPDEFELMKKHTIIGFDALAEASEGVGEDSYLKMARNIALYHHERWDGRGYPYGIAANEIPVSARIVTVGDIYDALTTFRPYKEAYSHEKVLKIMKEESYRFDPGIFKVFLENHEEFNTIRRQFS